MERERRAERRMAGEGQLLRGREDPHLHVPVRLRRVHERRLRVVHLPREQLEPLLRDLTRVGEDGELVAGQRRVREDVADDVPKSGHDTETILRPMRLVIVRHAEAAPGEPDELRSLTAQGREQARALGAPEVDERLSPGASPEDVRDAAWGRGETVLLVGHQPDCGRAVLALSGHEVLFPPAGYAELEL